MIAVRGARRAAAALTLVLLACGPESPHELAEIDFEGAAHPELIAHTVEFEKRIYRVTEGVHVAVGFGLANSILIEGEDAVIIVDVLGSVESARAVRAEFEKITRKPIAALIYTHNHADHVFGGRGFVPSGEIDVYAHETTSLHIDRVVSLLRPILSMRSARMFGNHLPRSEDGLVNAGIGAFLEIGRDGSTLGLIRPNRTFRDRLEIEIAGVHLVLVHAPGETDDQLFVWLPEKKVLLPGDNIYKAFPNLYTIRGTAYRDVLEWTRSLDRMRALHPEHLVPSHTRPVSGADAVMELLTVYRDAIQYVHDQTIRGMNQGLGPEDLVERIELPPHLQEHPYLRELYGTVEWSVRSIFTGYLGWFGGDAARLSPAGPDERAAGFVALAGGESALLDAARQALEEERYAWAAELAGELVRHAPARSDARHLQAAALRALGRRSISPNARNTYLTQALELEGKVRIEQSPIDESALSLAYSIPIGNFMGSMPVNLDPERSAEVDIRVGFRFPDVGEGYTLHVRHGVAEFQRAFPENPDISITTDSRVWKEIVLGQRNPALALASSDVQIEGSTLDLIAFLRMFR